MHLWQRLHPKAILIGVVVGMVLAWLLGPLEILFVFGPSLSGTPLHIASMATGFLATLFAAYVTAHNSPSNKFTNVFVFWAINETAGLLSLFVSVFPGRAPLSSHQHACSAGTLPE